MVLLYWYQVTNNTSERCIRWTLIKGSTVPVSLRVRWRGALRKNTLAALALDSRRVKHLDTCSWGFWSRGRNDGKRSSTIRRTTGGESISIRVKRCSTDEMLQYWWWIKSLRYTHMYSHCSKKTTNVTEKFFSFYLHLYTCIFICL